MNEQLQKSTYEQPTPEQVAAAQGIVDYCKGVVVGYDQDRRESDVPAGFNDRMTRYLMVTTRDDDKDGAVNENEKYLLHMHRGGYGVDLGVVTNDGRSDITIDWGGFATMRAQDSDANRLTEPNSIPLSDGQLEFANAVADAFKATRFADIEPSGLSDWSR